MAESYGIDTKAFKEDEVLFFIRIKGKKHFFEKIYGKETINHFFGHLTQHHTISEYPNADHHIDINGYQISDLTSDDYEVYYEALHSDLASIIWRCRALRAIPFDDAKTLILKTCKFFNGFFKAHQYKLIVIHIIDSYVLDVMCRVAAKKNIKTLCLSEWFLRGYYRHTFYGELHSCREPSEAEIQKTLDHLSQNKKAFWLNNISRSRLLKRGMYLYFRQWTLYFSRYWFKYKLCGSQAYEYKFAKIFNLIKLNFFFIKKYFDNVSEEYILQNKDNIILLPLHTFPEANVDYWMNDSRHADYYTSLYEVLSFYRDNGKQIFIKEHPGFLYQRDPKIYKELKKFNNICLIDPFSKAANALDSISTVLVWHGTSGIEALCKNKKVIAFDHNYYSKGLIPSYKEYERAMPINKQQQHIFMRKLLAGVTKV